MNKKLLSALLLGALTVTSTGTLVSCKDYDDDITNLQNQIDANKAALEKIQALINSGNVITSVTQDGTGVKFTLSNGQSYTVKNGATGATGADGKDADVWTIGEDGYWYKNGEKTTFYALGTKGDKGDKGDTGATGAQGEKGDKGDKGDTGATGAQGEKGDKGDKGDTGATGATGAQGEKGDKGDKGDTGATGATGAQGEKGDKGDKGETGAQGEAGHYYRPNATTGTFDEYKADGTFVKTTDISWLGMGITAIDHGTYVTLGNVVIDGKLQTIRVAKGAELRSMVFNPEEYYQGIEAIQVDAYEYDPYELFKTDAEKPLHLVRTGNSWNLASDCDFRNFQDKKLKDAKVSYVPNVSLGYYLNPSNALVDLKDVNKFNFIVNDVKYTRANDYLFGNDFQITSVEADQATKGLVYVNASVNENNQAIKNLNNGSVTVAALRYNDGDTVITSDFAALHRALTNKFDIVYGADRSGTRFEGYVTDNALTEAVKAYQNLLGGATFSVAYNSSFDFNTTIRAAYAPNDAEMQVMSYRKQKTAGFEFEYELVPYILGNEKTDQNAHVEKLENGVLTPVAKRSSIGRIALVRVKLIDTKHNNKVVSVGYAAVKITDEKADAIDGGSFSFDNKYTLVCDNNDFATVKVTWKQMESIYDKLGISREEFQNTYYLDRHNVNGQWVAAQFTDLFSEKLVDTDFGVVNKTTTDSWDDETNVLVWTIGNNEAYDFAANKENVEKKVIVRFLPYPSSTKYNSVYVTLTWKPASRLVDPTIAIVDANDKAKSAWFKSESAEEGYADLHAHISEAKAGKTDRIYSFSVAASTFKNAAGEVISTPHEMIQEKLKAAGYESLSNHFKLVYSFNEADDLMAGSAVKGKDYYRIDISADKVYAITPVAEKMFGMHTALVAEINPNTGLITYQDNDIAKDILNYKGHKDLKAGETFQLPVVVSVKACEPAQDAVVLNNNTFNVKFLRPVNIASAKAEVVDANPSTHVKTVEFAFTDWRSFNNKTVYNSSSKATDLFHFYGVKSIKQDMDRDVITNFGGSDAKLNPNDFRIAYSGADNLNEAALGTDPKFGTIKYEKLTTAAVHEFYFKVPVVVTYDWGSIYTEITVTVKPTVDNATEK